MRNNRETILDNLMPPEPPDGLLERILERICKEQRLMIIKRRLALIAVVLLGSATALIPAWQAMQTTAAESGFMRFASLLFSDSAAVLASGQSFAWALLESLPATGLAAFLAATLVFAASLRHLVQNIKAAYAPFNYKQPI